MTEERFPITSAEEVFHRVNRSQTRPSRRRIPCTSLNVSEKLRHGRHSTTDRRLFPHRPCVLSSSTTTSAARAIIGTSVSSKGLTFFRHRTYWWRTSLRTQRGGIVKTVVLEVRSLGEALDNAARVMKTDRADREARIGFAWPDLLWQVRTAKRWDLLNAMCGADPISIREVARHVGRDVKAVHGDGKALLAAGVISRTAAGAVEFPFESVKVEFMLNAA